MKEKINLLAEEMKKYGIVINNGAGKESISDVESQSRVTFPEMYKDLLGEVNGFDFNGVILYSVDKSNMQNVPDIISMNDTWREMLDNSDELLIVGEDDISLFGFKTGSNSLCVWDKYTNEVIKEFYDIDMGFSTMIEESIG